MARLPVNLLLYTVSLGLAGTAGWRFMEAFEIRQQTMDLAHVNKLSNGADDLIRGGRALKPKDERWRYDRSTQHWWKQLQSVNLTGKLPPPPEQPTEEEPQPEEPKASGIPLDEIFVIESLMKEMKEVREVTEAGPSSEVTHTHVVIRYISPEVRPPADVATGPAGWSPADTTPRNTGPNGGAIPFAGGAGEVRQHLFVQDTLWPPFAHIRLVGITDDAQEAIFQREDPAVAQEEWGKNKERLAKNELDLDKDVLSALLADRRRNAGQNPETGAPGEVEPELPRVASGWADPEQTRQVEPGEFHVSRKDYAYLRDQSERVFNEDIVLRSYVSRGGRFEGLQIGRVSPRMAAFGFQQGEVILSVNGEKVKNTAQAIKLGRKQYGRGTRRFVAEVLTPRGTIESRTVVAPSK